MSSKALLPLDHLGIAILKFDPHATIRERAAPMDWGALKAGERVRWP